MDFQVRIELLGQLCVRSDRGVINSFRTKKAAALLGYLACHRRRLHPRELLIDVLWPNAELEARRNSFNVTLTRLRQELEAAGVPGGIIVSEQAAVYLSPGGVTTDVEEFETALQQAAQTGSDEEKRQALLRAVDLYQGPLLPGFYENWALIEQQRLAERYLTAVFQLITKLEQKGRLKEALDYARRAVNADCLCERAHRRVMRLSVALGEPAAALRQYQQLERSLQERTDAGPAAATRKLALEVERLMIESGETPALRVATLSESQILEPASSEPVAAQTAASQECPWLDRLEPDGGAIPLDSTLYVERPADREFRAAVARRDSIVLVKGPRQVGKTSLLARSLQLARQRGTLVAVTDFKGLSLVQVASSDSLLFALAESLADQLQLETAPDAVWKPERAWNVNFERYLRRHVLGQIDAPLVWGLDGVDRLFHIPFHTEVFALFRSWHDQRALDPAGPWQQVTLAMAYATEAHLFIRDLNLSPFNVGTRLTLEDFTRHQVAELNRRYGSPLQEPPEMDCYFALVGGHPYLVRQGLRAMATRRIDLRALEAQVERDGDLFGEHLRRMLHCFNQDAELCSALHAVLEGEPCPSEESFYRLRSAGVLRGESPSEASLRCQLYRRYLEKHLP
jgi:DNA-binding SARP family transcriptional activator